MSRATASVERELKLHLAPQTVLPALDLAGVEVEALGVTALHSTYHDTADARLARWGVTLRRRTGGEDEGWHLKLPAGLGRTTGDGLSDRVELHLPLSAGQVGSPPAELLDVVTALTRGGAVVPLAAVQTRRRVWMLRAPSDDGAPTPVAVVADDGVVTTRIDPDGHVREGTTFREVEVELVPGVDGAEHPRARKALAHVRSKLTEVGATPSPRSKGAVALGELAAGPADVVVPELPARPSVADVVRLALARQVVALLAADVAIRRGQEAGIHDFRVAARTLRSVLRTFGPVCDAEWATGLRQELGWISNALGEARDTEVLLGLLHDDVGLLAARERRAGTVVDDDAAARDVADAWEAIARVLEPRRDTARERAVVALGLPRYLALLDRLVAAAARPDLLEPVATKPARAVLGPLLGSAARTVRRRAAKLERGRDPRAWHRTRIAAKRARYGADALALTGWKRARRAAATLRSATGVLGDVHDAHVARRVLREIAADERTPAPTGYLLGLLDAVEAEHERGLQGEFLDSRRALRAELKGLLASL